MYPVPNKVNLNINPPKINYKWANAHIMHMGFWTNVSKRGDLTEDFIRTYKDSLNWWTLSANPSLPVTKDFIYEFIDRIKWRNLSKMALPEDFITEFIDYVDINTISFKAYLSDDFLMRFASRINWSILCKYRKVSEEFLEKFISFIDWNTISNQQTLSMEFVEKYKDKLNLPYVVYNYRIPYAERQKIKKKYL